MIRILLLLCCLFPTALLGQFTSQGFNPASSGVSETYVQTVAGDSSQVVAEALALTEKTIFPLQGFQSPSLNTQKAREAISSGQAWTLNLIGDSRFNQGNTPTELMRTCADKYGVRGFAFPLGAGNSFQFITNTNSGTTISDVAGNGLLSISGFSRDFSTGDNYTINFAEDTLADFTDLEIFYVEPPTASAVSVTVNGTPTVYNLTTGSGISSITISGIANGSDQLVFAHSSGADFSLLELVASKSGQTGCLLVNLGNSGISANVYSSLTSNTYLLSDLQPELTLIRLGANDLTNNIASAVAGLESVIDWTQSYSGGVFVISETDNLSGLGEPADFNAAFYQSVREKSAGWIDLYSYVPDWTIFRDSLGLASGGDPIHENSTGAKYIADAIFHSLYSYTDYAGGGVASGIANRVPFYSSTSELSSSNLLINNDGNSLQIPASDEASLKLPSSGNYLNAIGFGLSNQYGHWGNLVSRLGYPYSTSFVRLLDDGRFVRTGTLSPQLMGRTGSAFSFALASAPAGTAGDTLEIGDFSSFFQISNSGRIKSTAYTALDGVVPESIFRNLAAWDAAGVLYSIPQADALAGLGITLNSSIGGNNLSNIALRTRAGNNAGSILTNLASQFVMSYNGGNQFSHRLVTRHTGAGNGLQFYAHKFGTDANNDLGTGLVWSAVWDPTFNRPEFSIGKQNGNAELDVLGDAIISGNITAGTAEITGALTIQDAAADDQAASFGQLTDIASTHAAASATTDVSGDLTITHSLGVAPSAIQITVEGTTFYHAQYHTLTTTNFKVRITDALGAPQGSTAITLSYLLKE